MQTSNCDVCGKPAVVHEVTVKGGVKKEMHLCAEHAREAGIVVAATQPLNELLTQFVLKKSAKRSAGAGGPSQTRTCPNCGRTFAEFRQHSVLGCAECYETFEGQLSPLIERAQGGATHHVGKTPRRAGGSIDRQRLVQQIVRELDEAVAAEQYERAAELRDRLMKLKTEATPAPARQTAVRRAASKSGEEVRGT